MKAADVQPRTEINAAWVWPAVVALAIVGAYANACRGPFVLDDGRWIVENARIRELWPVSLSMAGTSRPFLQFTLAVNYALGGLDVVGYHVLNMALHVAAALALYGLVWRSIVRVNNSPLDNARRLGGVVALLWGLHPLATQTVNYVVQRGELLMAVCLLCTLYVFVRATEPGRQQMGGWGITAVLFCLAGMLSKPVMVIAPVAVWWYDRAFVAGSFGEAWRRRRPLYVALAATWLVLPVVLANGKHDWIGSAGVGVAHVTSLAYALTQTEVIWHYLRLAVWPVGLCFDPLWPVANSWREVWLPGLGILGLFGASVWLGVRRPVFGFVAGMFWLLLAPTSSFLVIDDLAFEHRMYLPLAVLVVLAVLGWRKLKLPLAVNVGVGVAVAVALLLGTVRRNQVYQDDVTLWRDTLRHAPHNYRALNNLGNALDRRGEKAKAEALYRQSLVVNPRYDRAHYNLAALCVSAGRVAEGIEEYRLAIAANPGGSDAYYNLGLALARSGKVEEAVPQFATAAQRQPGSHDAYYNWGFALVKLGRDAEAIGPLREAARLSPESGVTRYQLGRALARMGQTAAARSELQMAQRLLPRSSEVRTALAELPAE